MRCSGGELNEFMTWEDPTADVNGYSISPSTTAPSRVPIQQTICSTPHDGVSFSTPQSQHERDCSRPSLPRRQRALTRCPTLSPKWRLRLRLPALPVRKPPFSDHRVPTGRRPDGNLTSRASADEEIPGHNPAGLGPIPVSQSSSPLPL